MPDDSAAEVVSLAEHREVREQPRYKRPPEHVIKLQPKQQRIARRGLRKARQALEEARRKAATDGE